MPYTQSQILEHSKRIGRSVRCLRYWIAQGCNLNDPASVETFLAEKNRKKTNVQKFRERRGMTRGDSSSIAQRRDGGGSKPQGNGQVSDPVGKHGAAHTLTRLEHEEQESFRRLQTALASGDRLAIDACQTYWLKVAETLRRLDVSIEINRRQEETQISLKVAQDTVLFVSEWMRIAISQFLSSEASVMTGGFSSTGEFKCYFWERFRGILDLTIKGADRTRSALPPWAKSAVETAWNVKLDEPVEETRKAENS